MTDYSATEINPEGTSSLSLQQVDEFKHKSVNGAVSFMLRSAFINFFAIATSLVLGYYLLPSDFGVYGLVAQVIGILQFFSSVGLGPTLIQKKEEPTLNEYQTVFTVQQLLSWAIFIVAVIIIISGVLGDKIGWAGNWIFLALAFSFPLVSLRTISAIMLERKLDFSKMIIPSVCEQIIYNIVLLISVVVFHQGAISFAYAIIIRDVVGVTVMFFLKPWKVGLAWDQKVIKAFLAVALKFQASDLLAKAKDQLFFLYLGARVFSPTEFGYISWAQSWSHTPYDFTVQNVIEITFPAYSRLQEDTKLLKRAIEKTMYFISAIIFPILAGMSVFIIPFTSIVLKYHKWQPALPTFILFTLSIGWAAISTPLTNTLSAIGHINKTTQLMVMWTALTWILTPICIHFLGFNGVAMAAFLISFTSVVPIIFVKKYVAIDVWSHVKDAFIATVVMSVFSISLLPFLTRGFPQFIVGGVSAGVVYLLTFVFIGKQKLQEEVRSLLKAKKRR